MRKLREFAKDFLQEEDAVGVVEIILILVVLIGLVMIFKDQSCRKYSVKDHQTKQLDLKQPAVTK